MPAIARRALLLASAALATAAAADLPPPDAPAGLWSDSAWASKQRDGQTIRLALYRKRAGAPQPGERKLPVLLLVHGSSPCRAGQLRPHHPR